MNRDAALALLEKQLKNRNLVRHCLAVESCMVALARDLGLGEQEVEVWSLAGLLHDLDYEQTADSPERHGRITVQILEELGVEERVRRGILAHAGNAPRDSALEKAIYAVDPITGLIVAAALMHPTKSLAGLDVPFVLKRFKEKRFAAGADRSQISACQELGYDLETFTGHCLKAMQGISSALGL
jgi:putative nucleotidyltransferase with HDIG domain